MPDVTRSILLDSRPDGPARAENFRLDEEPTARPGDGEVLVRVIWLSLDPYMRGRMDDAESYADPVGLGDVMEGEGVGEVIESRASGFSAGDIVAGRFGWTDHAVEKARTLRRIDPDEAPIQTALGVLGMTGLTAWVGINRILEVREGATVAISAATGAVGTVAGQLARAKGCRVVGIAGGAEKCAYAREALGYDACIDHHAHEDGAAMGRALREAAPDGIDAYFENVGGKTLEGVLRTMAQNGRIAVCGMVAWYSGQGARDAMPLPAVWRAILVKRLRVQGFLVPDHADAYPDFRAEVAPMVREGRLAYRESVTEGLENAPRAFIEMLGGGNFGKTLVRVGRDP